jgi:hypothetical protein
MFIFMTYPFSYPGHPDNFSGAAPSSLPNPPAVVSKAITADISHRAVDYIPIKWLMEENTWLTGLAEKIFSWSFVTRSGAA